MLFHGRADKRNIERWYVVQTCLSSPVFVSIIWFFFRAQAEGYNQLAGKSALQFSCHSQTESNGTT